MTAVAAMDFSRAVYTGSCFDEVMDELRIGSHNLVLKRAAAILMSTDLDAKAALWAAQASNNAGLNFACVGNEFKAAPASPEVSGTSPVNER